MRRSTQYLMAAGLMAALITGASSTAFIRESGPKPSEIQVGFLFVTEPEQSQVSAKAVAEVPFPGSQTAVFQISDVTDGTVYTPRFRLYDASGRQVVDQEVRFTAKGTSCTVWVTHTVDEIATVPGKWRWMVTDKDIGRFFTTVTVLPPTAAHLKTLALHDRARQEVFRAFSRCYLGRGDHLFTQVVAFPEPLARLAPPDSDQMAPPDIQPPQVCLLELSGVSCSLVRASLNEVDVLNGVTYRATATFGCHAYRLFVPERGWSDWRELSSPKDLPEALLRIIFSPFEMVFAPGSLEWRFEVRQRDGHWWVKNERGDSWVNGSAVDRALCLPGIGRLFVQLPEPETVDRLKDDEAGQRSVERASGIASLVVPVQSDRDALETMALLESLHLAR